MGLEAVYVGERVGPMLGVTDGNELGHGVGLPAVYVGLPLGLTLGAIDGMVVGRGVGLPRAYVGDAVAVGTQLGVLLG